jgi:hypothetical protein
MDLSGASVGDAAAPVDVTPPPPPVDDADDGDDDDDDDDGGGGALAVRATGTAGGARIGDSATAGAVDVDVAVVATDVDAVDDDDDDDDGGGGGALLRMPEPELLAVLAVTLAAPLIDASAIGGTCGVADDDDVEDADVVGGCCGATVVIATYSLQC